MHQFDDRYSPAIHGYTTHLGIFILFEQKALCGNTQTVLQEMCKRAATNPVHWTDCLWAGSL